MLDTQLPQTPRRLWTLNRTYRSWTNRSCRFLPPPRLRFRSFARVALACWFLFSGWFWTNYLDCHDLVITRLTQTYNNNGLMGSAHKQQPQDLVRGTLVCHRCLSSGPAFCCAPHSILTVYKTGSGSFQDLCQTPPLLASLAISRHRRTPRPVQDNSAVFASFSYAPFRGCVLRHCSRRLSAYHFTGLVLGSRHKVFFLLIFLASLASPDRSPLFSRTLVSVHAPRFAACTMDHLHSFRLCTSLFSRTFHFSHQVCCGLMGSSFTQHHKGTSRRSFHLSAVFAPAVCVLSRSPRITALFLPVSRTLPGFPTQFSCTRAAFSLIFAFASFLHHRTSANHQLVSLVSRSRSPFPKQDIFHAWIVLLGPGSCRRACA